MNNMMLYEKFRTVPNEAKRSIQSGRLKGKTDINPMYRIKSLTEAFGPCGMGWWYVIKDERIIGDENTKEKSAFVDIDLYYRNPDTGEISQPIPGTGGASFISSESKGLHMSDECFKMALTDAISVSCKALGIGADVYWEKDKTKYTDPDSGRGDADNTPQTPEERRAELEKSRNRANQPVDNIGPRVITCERCGKPIKAGQLADKSFLNVPQIVDISIGEFKAVYCYRCISELRAKRDGGAA